MREKKPGVRIFQEKQFWCRRIRSEPQKERKRERGVIRKCDCLYHIRKLNYAWGFNLHFIFSCRRRICSVKCRSRRSRIDTETLLIVTSCRWQAPWWTTQWPGANAAQGPVVSAQQHRRRRRRRKKKKCPSDSAESASMQPGTMCWIGSLYISLPFGHSNATLPYEGSSTRSTCSKQNATGDQLQRPPSGSDCFSDRHSHLQERGGRKRVRSGGGRERRGVSINCSAEVQTIKQLVGDFDSLRRTSPNWQQGN